LFLFVAMSSEDEYEDYPEGDDVPPGERIKRPRKKTAKAQAKPKIKPVKVKPAPLTATQKRVRRRINILSKEQQPKPDGHE